MGDAQIPNWIKLTVLALAGFLYRAYPHLLVIPRFIIEEEYNYMTVDELVRTGSTNLMGFYPVLEHYLIYWTHLATGINPEILSVYANPLFGALTVVPVYYLAKRYLGDGALMACAFWSFSEAAFYRASYFGSTEALGFLLSFSSLVLLLSAYDKFNKYRENLRSVAFRALGSIICIVLAFQSHILPSIFILGVILGTIFFKSQTRVKVIVTMIGIAAVGFLYSPLNPHQRLVASIDPTVLLSKIKIENLGIYGLEEILGSIPMFAGFMALALVALPSLRKTDTFMRVWLLAAAGLFAFSWIGYSANLFAPPRLTFYFIIPFSILATRTLSGPIFGKFVVAALCLLMVTSSVAGLQPMLYVDDCLSAEEYAFIEKITEIQPVTCVTEWYTDYPVQVELTKYYEKTPSTELNMTTVESLSRDMLDPETATTHKFYRFVIVTPRMNRNSLFMIYSDGRTRQIHKPISDIWSSDPSWKLVYEDNGMKFYRRNIG